MRASIGVSALIGLTLSVLLMLMATAPSQAQEAADVCGAEFNELRAHLDDDPKNPDCFIPITGGKSDKERAGLLRLVNDAEALVSDGKISDAVKKLSDFTVKVDQLEAAGRISVQNAKELRSDAQETIASLQGSTASD